MNIRIPYFLLFSFMATGSMAQESKTVYTDKNDKPCPEDSAWTKKVATKEADGRWHVFECRPKTDHPFAEGHYTDDLLTLREGEFIYYNDFKQKKIEVKGLYKNGKREGLWKSVYSDNAPKSSVFYVNGLIKGASLTWYQSGELSDSSVMDENGNGYSKGFWKDGGIEHYGLFAAGKKNGDWTYYYKNGQPSAIEKLNAGEHVSATCYDEKGKLAPHCEMEVESEFPGGASAWIRYLSAKMSKGSFPKEYFDGKIYGQVIVQFIVDETGRVNNAEVIGSLHPDLDKIALLAVKQSPKWIPALQNGRYVKSYKKQPVKFPKYPGR